MSVRGTNVSQTCALCMKGSKEAKTGLISIGTKIWEVREISNKVSKTVATLKGGSLENELVINLFNTGDS